MDYVELTVAVSDDTLSEILVAELSELGFDSFATERTLLKAYIPQMTLADTKSETDALLGRYGIADARYVQIESQNWNALWESNFDEVEIDGRAIVRAPFHAPRPEYGPMEIVIMPQMSFGTGHHATTALMISFLLDASVEGRRMLDMGCGTGVLAIVALRRGAAGADAVDIDDMACENCRDNAAANGVGDRMKVIAGDVRSVIAERYDIIAANINRNILLRDMKAYASMLTPGGSLFLSGFLIEDAAAVTSAAEAAGLRVAERRTRNDWAAVACVK